MNPTLDTFHKILTGNLKPWTQGDVTNEQFKARTAELQEIKKTHPEKYSLKFIKPFSSKTKYYAFEIRNSVALYMNELSDHLISNNSDNIKTNLIYRALKEELDPTLEKIATIINKEDYKSNYIDITNLTKTDAEQKENTFIFQLLKASAIQLYLEIEDLGRAYLKTEYLELEDIHYQFFDETIPDFYTITKSNKKTKDPIKTSVPKVKVSKQEHHSFTLKNLAREQYKLTNVCDSLKKNKFIHDDTTPPIFKKIFSGQLIEIPVKWTGYKSELAYFIKQIHNKHKLVESLKQEHWKVTAKCFVEKDGSSFDKSEFRELKKPSRFAELDIAIDHLK